MLSTAYDIAFIQEEKTDLPEHHIRRAEIQAESVAQTMTNSPTIYFTELLERYGGLDLDYYRTAMTNFEYRAYIDFIGEESFESDFLPSDFEMYYPDDED